MPTSGTRKKRACRDCAPGTVRPAPKPGPRCVSHHRQVVKQRKQATHDTYVQKTYGLEPGEYERLYEFQGGKCFICQRATGAKRRLAVDHDHSCCAELPGCGQCVRGLACKVCNRTLGFYRDDPAAFERAAEYLRDWPMQRMRNGAKV